MKAPFVQDTSYFTVLRGRPPAPLVSPKASGNHLSDAVRSMFLRDPSLLRPQVPVGPYRRPRCFGSRVPPALPPWARHGRLLLWLACTSRAYSHACMGPERARDPQGVSQGGPREGPQSAILLCNGVILEVILVPPFFWCELAHSPTKSSKMGVQKVVKTGPLGRVLGELGCLLFLLRVFKTNLL